MQSDDGHDDDDDYDGRSFSNISNGYNINYGMLYYIFSLDITLILQ